jgi:undecaprenyl-diphosphatase
MALWYAALLGLVQGLTEFIPVSSTAHLRIVPALFGFSDDGAAYTAVIQLGTLAAVLVYFARDLTRMARAVVADRRSQEARLAFLIALATLPIVIAGLALRHRIESPAVRSLYVIAANLIVIGVAMAVIDRRAGASGRGRTIDTITLRDAMLVGLAQSLALAPGVSRSGATICAALLVGFARSDAARFSFLLSIPAVGGAGILEARKAAAELGSDAIGPLVVGIGVAAIVGYATIAWLLRWLSSHRLVHFAVYRVLVGIALFAALAAGAIAPT